MYLVADQNEHKYFDQYYEDVIDHATISVSFIGMTLTPKYTRKGCQDQDTCGNKAADDDDDCKSDCGIQVLAIDADDTGRHAMTTKILTERFAPGLIISYVKHLNPYLTLDVEFQGFLNWHKQEYARSKSCDNSHIEIPFGPLNYCINDSDWNSAGFAFFRYDTSLNSIAANILSHSTPVFLDYFTLSGAGGLRYILYSENLKIKAHTPTSLSCYNVETNNNLIGLQAGGSFSYSSSSFYRWTLNLRGGVFANLIQAHPQLFDYNNSVVLFNETVNERTLSYLVELHPISVYNITENFFIETAYQGLVIWNLSLATKFVTFSRDQTDIFTRSYRYYNSFQAGLGFRF